MNESNLDDFLGIEKRIVFPLLDEAIKKLKEFNVFEYTINENILRFIENQTAHFKIVYNEKNDNYTIYVKGSRKILTARSEKFIKELDFKLQEQNLLNQLWNVLPFNPEECSNE